MSATTDPVECADACTAADAPPACPSEGKAFATLRARAALAGWVLASFTEPAGPTTYTLCKWGLARTLPDLAAVAQFLRQVGVPE